MRQAGGLGMGGMGARGGAHMRQAGGLGIGRQGHEGGHT